jgi:hypothetical protein
MSQSKKAYFQGGGGVNEPTPGKPKYKAEPAILVQPRFEEPFYRNYDVYNTEGVDGPAKYGPGAGWHHMHEYKSIKEYLQHQRQRLKGKYVADDMWITEENRKKRVEMMSVRASLLSRIVKTAASDENDGPNFDYGDGAYDAMSKGKKMETITDAPHRSPGAFFADDNELDFQYDDIDAKPHAGPIVGNSEDYNTPTQLGPTGLPDDITISPGEVNLGEFESYPYGAQLGGMYDKYLGKYDIDDKPESTLDWDNDLPESTEAPGSHSFESVHDNNFSGCYSCGYNSEDPKLGIFDTTYPCPKCGKGGPGEPRDEGSLAKLDEYERKYLNPAPTHGLYGLPDGVDLPDEDLGDPTDIQPDYGTLGPESKMYEDKWNI